MEDSDTLQVDLYLALTGMFSALFLLAILLINPIGAKETAIIASPGSVIAEIRWPDNLRTDVDLWVQAPGERPVGYSNKNGKVFNLLRDDLGKTRDFLKLNYENAFSRGVPEGEWIINIHLYSNVENTWPIPVSVQVRRERNGTLRNICSSEIKLNYKGEEITVCRFKTDERGNIISGSIHRIPKTLRQQR